MASTGSLSVLVPPDRAEITGSVAPPESATNDPVARRQGGPPSWRTLQRIWLLLPPCKLKDYCLSPEHPRGRHKARVFREALDIRRIDASWLREVLLEAVHGTEAVELATDAWGTHWRIDVTVRRHGKSALVGLDRTNRRVRAQIRDLLGVAMEETRPELNEGPSLLDVVALLADVAAMALARGQVGTVVEQLDEGTLLVEFSDDQGCAYALAPCPHSELLVLRYAPQAA
jgi:hypothetical protein